LAQKRPWIWAVGIEDTFIAQTGRGERVLDEYELTQHYRYWKEDLDRVRETGVSMIRYGVPWYRIEREDGVFDWSWTDQVMAYFDAHRELIPIIDLIHYGTPLWMEREFMNERYPEYVARYAAAFVERYRHITSYYTPLNEPFVNAEWCGWSGTWPPYLRGLSGFVSMMRQLCKGIVLTVESVKRLQPEAVLVHVEAAKKYVPADASFAEPTQLWNEIRYVMWELVQGRVDGAHPLAGWLLSHGMTPEDLAWFREKAIEVDIVGINYYPQFSVNVIDKEVIEKEKIPAPVLAGEQELVEIAVDIYRRYGRPVFITETSYNGDERQRVEWLEKVVEAGSRIVEEGVDLFGITWFPFMDMVDWPYRTNGRSIKENMATFGLYTLEEMPDGTLRRVKNEAGKRFETEVKARKIE